MKILGTAFVLSLFLASPASIPPSDPPVTPSQLVDFKVLEPREDFWIESFLRLAKRLDRDSCAALWGGKSEIANLVAGTVLYIEQGFFPLHPSAIAVTYCPLVGAPRVAIFEGAAKLVGPGDVAQAMVHEMLHVRMCGQGIPVEKQHKIIANEIKACYAESRSSN